jgi:hypothetical protein
VSLEEHDVAWIQCCDCNREVSTARYCIASSRRFPLRTDALARVSEIRSSAAPAGAISELLRAFKETAAHSVLFTRNVRGIDVLLCDTRGAAAAAAAAAVAAVAPSLGAASPAASVSPSAPTAVATPSAASAAGAATAVPVSSAPAPGPALLFSVVAAGRDDTPESRAVWTRLSAFVAGPDASAPLPRDALYAKYDATPDKSLPSLAARFRVVLRDAADGGSVVTEDVLVVQARVLAHSLTLLLLFLLLLIVLLLLLLAQMLLQFMLLLCPMLLRLLRLPRLHLMCRARAVDVRAPPIRAQLFVARMGLQVLGGGRAKALACDPENRGLKLLPWAGAAATLSRTVEGGAARGAGAGAGASSAAAAGRVFCFLPLPVASGTPVHINGYFELSSNRRDIWYAAAYDKRAWSCVLRCSCVT